MYLESANIGSGVVVRVTAKAALIRFDTEALGERWVPYSVMTTSTASGCRVGATIDQVRVVRWFAGKLD